MTNALALVTFFVTTNIWDHDSLYVYANNTQLSYGYGYTRIFTCSNFTVTVEIQGKLIKLTGQPKPFKASEVKWKVRNGSFIYSITNDAPFDDDTIHLTTSLP